MEELSTASGEIEIWEPAEVFRAMDEGRIVLVDVRTTPEFMLEHIRGALLMPLPFFEPGGLPGQESKRIVFHCGSGMRSERAARAALAAGVHPVAHMKGGFGAWKEARLPYMGTDMATGQPKPVDGAG